MRSAHLGCTERGPGDQTHKNKQFCVVNDLFSRFLHLLIPISVIIIRNRRLSRGFGLS